MECGRPCCLARSVSKLTLLWTCSTWWPSFITRDSNDVKALSCPRAHVLSQCKTNCLSPVACATTSTAAAGSHWQCNPRCVSADSCSKGRRAVGLEVLGSLNSKCCTAGQQLHNCWSCWSSKGNKSGHCSLYEGCCSVIVRRWGYTRPCLKSTNS
jgi:hypothetical protein